MSRKSGSTQSIEVETVDGDKAPRKTTPRNEDVLKLGRIIRIIDTMTAKGRAMVVSYCSTTDPNIGIRHEG